MASLTTVRLLIVASTFIIISFGLFYLSVSGTPFFFSSSNIGANRTQGSSTNPVNLLATNITNAVVLNSTDWDNDYTGLSDWANMEFSIVTDDYYNWFVLIEKYDDFLGLRINREDFKWYNISDSSQELSQRVNVWRIGTWPYGGLLMQGYHEVMPIPLSYSGWSLDDLYATFNKTEATLSNSKGNIDVHIGFNETAYIQPSSAIQTGEQGLYFSLNQDFSDRRTSINILSFIGYLFAFDIPSVPAPIDWFISMIWYSAIIPPLVYVIFTVVRSLIPFLGGED